jgi:hypothetical protein
MPRSRQAGNAAFAAATALSTSLISASWTGGGLLLGLFLFWVEKVGCIHTLGYNFFGVGVYHFECFVTR